MFVRWRHRGSRSLAHLRDDVHKEDAVGGGSVGGGQQDATYQHYQGGGDGADTAADPVGEEAQAHHADNDAGDLTVADGVQ